MTASNPEHLPAATLAKLETLLTLRVLPTAIASLSEPGREAPGINLETLLERHHGELSRWWSCPPEPATQSEDASFASDPIAYLRGAIEGDLRCRNQFAMVTAAARLELENALLTLLSELATALGNAGSAERRPLALAEAFANHQLRLGEWLRAQVAGGEQRVVSEQYSAELQRVVFGWEELPAGPLLDLGCGTEARLVCFLRAHGVEAQGLDREATSELGIRGDWLTTPLPKRHYQTICSHLGFSLHFLHHHLRPEPTSLVYAKRYMQILEALQLGGAFHYVPALPFLEELLPAERFRVERRLLPEGLRTGFLPFEEALGDERVTRSTRVVRLAD